MTYIWKNPDVERNLLGEFINESCFGFDCFNEATHFSSDVIPIFRFNCKLSCLNGFQLANGTIAPLVNESICGLLSGFSDEIQFVKVRVEAVDGVSDDFYIVNVLKLVDVLDKQKSKCFFVTGTKDIMGFSTLVYKDDDFSIARDVNYLMHLLVNDELAMLLIEHGCKGLYLPHECV